MESNSRAPTVIRVRNSTDYAVVTCDRYSALLCCYSFGK